jgi:ABC-type thiamin/hydroxymethylpyrimidine transport system permease subunit
MVMLGGVFLAIAALCVTFVRDVGVARAAEVLAADAHEPLLVQESVQPVPSTGPDGAANGKARSS